MGNLRRIRSMPRSLRSSVSIWAFQGTSAARGPGAFGTALRTNGPSFLLVTLVESRMGVCTASLIPVEVRDGLGSLNVGMNSSPVESFEVFPPILGPALGKVTAKGSVDRLMVIRIKDIEQGRTNADHNSKEEPKE